MTFSESLAKLIVSSVAGLEIRRWSYIAGRRLDTNEKSKTGLYGIMSMQSNIALRISCIQETAEMYRDENSRYLCEIYIDIDND